MRSVIPKEFNEDNFVFGSEGQFSEKMPEFALQFDRMKKEKVKHPTKMNHNHLQQMKNLKLKL